MPQLQRGTPGDGPLLPCTHHGDTDATRANQGRASPVDHQPMLTHKDLRGGDLARFDYLQPVRPARLEAQSRLQQGT